MADLTHPEADHPVSTPLNSEQFLLKIAHLSQELEKAKQEKADLEIVLEAMTEHAGVIEAELHHEAEAAKQESQERFQLIAEATPVAIVIARFADGQLLYANAAASFIFGLPIEELLTHSMLDFYADPNDRQKLFNIYTQNHCLRNYEIRFKQANGLIFWGAISIQPFSFNGEDVLLSAILDITKRKQADVDRIRFTQKLKEQHTQLQRLSVLKDKFLFNTSNELYTPLNHIVNTLQSLLETEVKQLTAQQQQQLLTVTQNGQQLLALINNIRDFSQHKHEPIQLHWQPLNLHSLAEEVLQSLQTSVGIKDLQLINAIPTSFLSIYADEQRLKQVLYNLVSRAIQSTEKGSVEISALAQELDTLTFITLTIADTGLGLSQAELEAISERLQPSSHPTPEPSTPQDLELSITQTLVELHGGTLRVESEIGFGTRFTFTLPVTPPTQTPPKHQPQTPLAVQPSKLTTVEPQEIPSPVATTTQTPSLLQRPQNRFARTLGRIPLHVILIVPFVVQVVGAVGLVGSLSFRNGQRAVNDLASQLRHEVTDRVRDRIQAYVEVPQQINQFNAHAIQLGLLDFQKIRDAELYFWRQVQTYESIGNVGFANQQGQFLRVGWINRLSTTEQPQIAQQFTPGGGTLYYYDIDHDGNRVKLAKTIANYDTRTRPYYTAAVQKGQPTWSEVYVNRGYDLLQIKASRPVYDRNNQLLGVLASELGLKQIGQFLQTLKIGQSGEVFLMEPTGELVASSMSHQALLGGNSKRLRALESNDLLMRSSAAFLRDRFPNFNQIDRPYNLEFQLKGQRQFLQISPFKDPYGLNWLIVVVVPESDFMAQIHANNRTTLLLCGATLVVAIIIGILTARWVTEPLVRLNFAAKDIAKGEWDKAVDLDRSDEVGQLAKSFNQMADQLKASFEALENHKNAFARFFPPEYLKFLHKQYVTHVHLGDYVSQEMAIMFSDIRSFTTLSESMTPQETFSFVNAYLQRVSPEIRKHQGIIVKYMGDGLMAIFPNRADDALQAGIAKLKKIRLYNQERLAKGYRPIYIGIGIHIGPIMVGMIGEENRMQGDALSDHVNLTARLEGLTKFYGVSLLISEQVLERLNDPSQYEIRFLDRAIVKGKTESIGVYEVMDGEAEEVKALKFQTQADFERGLEHYSRQEFAQAKHYFEQVLAVNLADKTAKLYLERIERLQAEGVPENWNGVWAFAEK